MDSPLMTLKEFDQAMQQGNYSYSLGVVLCLDAAAFSLKLRKGKSKAYRDELMADAYDWQITGLKQAEMEQKFGKTMEPRLKYMSTPNLVEAWKIYAKWEKYLAKIGRKIERIDFND